MKHKWLTMDGVLKWFTRLIFLWLVVWLFLAYTRYEWMMWK